MGEIKCKVVSCFNLSCTKEFCRKHYLRFHLYGDPLFTKYNRDHNEFCSIKFCNKPYASKELCAKHYKRLQKHGDPLKVIIIRDPTRKCKIKGCNRKYYSNGLCDKHNSHNKFINNPELHKLYNTRTRVRNRLKLIELLGGKCVKCGDKNIFHLQFDHINNDGHKDGSRTNGTPRMIRTYLNGLYDIKRLQILCANCNYEKQYIRNKLYIKIMKELLK